MPVDQPPSELDGCRVLAYASTDDPVVFTGRLRLNVDGQWLGRVPRLAICAFGSSQELIVLHCDESWVVLGLQGWNAPGIQRPGSIAEVISHVERYYQGLEARWVVVHAERA